MLGWAVVRAFAFCALAAAASAAVESRTTKEWDVVVVGGGLGGLSAAATVAAQQELFGPVVVLEQMHLGGYASSYVRDGYRFEAALHLFCDADYLARLGSPSSNVSWITVDPIWRVVFPDGSDFSAPANQTKHVELLKERFPDDTTCVDCFIRGPQGQAQSLQALLDSCCTNSVQKAYLASLWGFSGQVPALMDASTYLGVWQCYASLGASYPVGGAISITNTLAGAIQASGGTLIAGSPAGMVSNILVEKTANGTRVAAVQTADGTVHTAKAIVVNANIPGALQMIGSDNFPNKPYYHKWTTAPATVQLVTLNIAVKNKTVLAPLRGVHTTFFNYAWDYPDIRSAADGGYLCVTDYTSSDPSCAPEGGGVLSATTCPSVDVTTMSDDDAVEAYYNVLTKTLLGKLEATMPGFVDAIDFYFISGADACYSYTLNPHGDPYGYDATVGATRPFNQVPWVHGLYWASGWTRPGYGMVATIASGVFAGNMLAGDRATTPVSR
eukprot:TRINITY_DN5480_c0_g1_i1.p1 TRINITY_DN5480_c0_g1~~TRINITY_DN5480_c0_g1_i1.p1  ORF type:complete len:499 (-),score=80.29 TRINITY_DN5480_c0_g1_i1:871-2367(-)